MAHVGGSQLRAASRHCCSSCCCFIPSLLQRHCQVLQEGCATAVLPSNAAEHE